MHPLHTYIQHIIDEQLDDEETMWFFDFEREGSPLDTGEFSPYIPTLFALIDTCGDPHPCLLEIYDVLEYILPKSISAEQARMALAVLKDEEFEDADMHFHLLDKLIFPADTDITILEDTLDHNWSWGYKYKALRIITQVTGVNTESYLIERLRKNLRQRIASNGYQPDYCFIYDALAEAGSIMAIPSLMADREVNYRYRQDIDMAVKEICEREQLSEELKIRLMEPAFWKIDWNGTHADFAAFVLMFSTDLYIDNNQMGQASDPGLIAADINVIATALAKEVNLNLHPHASVSSLLRETLNETALDRLEQFTDIRKSDEFATSLISGTGVIPSEGSFDDTIPDALFREYFVTRICRHFNVIRE